MSSRVKAFEELIAWQKAMDLAVRVYEVSNAKPLSADFSLRNQVQRAAVSVPSNIAEGFERGSRAEFHRFLGIAKGSCGELSTQIQLAARVRLLDSETAADLVGLAREVSRIVGKLRSAIRPHTSMPSRLTRNPELGTRH